MLCPGCGRAIKSLEVIITGKLEAASLSEQYPDGFMAVGEKIVFDHKDHLRHECGWEFCFVGVGIVRSWEEGVLTTLAFLIEPTGYKLVREPYYGNL